MRTRLEHGDMRKVLARLAEEGVTVQSVVTDPPYHLTSIVRRFGAKEAAPATGPHRFKALSRGFMGQRWDGGDVAFQADTWRLCFDLLPPGGHLVAFGGTRTYHRLACAIEDAGFEIRDTVTWLYGTGFPKSHDVSKGIDAKVLRGKSRTEDMRKVAMGDDYKPSGRGRRNYDHGGGSAMNGAPSRGPITPEAAAWRGWGTALKPAAELICLARKPLAGTVAENVLEHGTGALNIDACRIPTDEAVHGSTTGNDIRGGRYAQGHKPAAELEPYQQHQGGRWPANLAHDGSEEVVAGFPVTGGGFFPAARGAGGIGNDGHRGQHGLEARKLEAGSASRFYFSAKASAADRLGSKHPTVKPVDLMRWLVRMVTPPGGTVLDPFAGSGSTLMACLAEGFGCIAVEKSPRYLADVRRRIKHVRAEDTPLFGKRGQAELFGGGAP